MPLSGTVALITGGAGGIGSQTARVFLRNNIKGITITDINKTRGEEIESALSKEFGDSRVLFVTSDASNEVSSKSAFEKTIEKFKHVDYLFNNASIIDENNWTKMVSYNLKGYIINTRLASEFIPKFKSKNYGVIINNICMSSIEVMEATPLYSSIKHGVFAFTQALGANDFYNDTKIKVMCILPGITRTEFLKQHPSFEQFAKISKFNQEAEDCANHVLKVLLKGTHGSIWLSRAKILNEVEFPSLQELRKPFSEPKDKKSKQKGP